MTKEKQNNWKDLIHGFVGNMLAQAEDNISQKIKIWASNLKRRTIGSLLMANGLIFLLIGVVTYASFILDPLMPGLGYLSVGVVVIIVGFLMSRK